MIDASRPAHWPGSELYGRNGRCENYPARGHRPGELNFRRAYLLASVGWMSTRHPNRFSYDMSCRGAKRRWPNRLCTRKKGVGSDLGASSVVVSSKAGTDQKMVEGYLKLD